MKCKKIVTEKKGKGTILYCTPKVRVKSDFWGVDFMAKYSEKFKLMVVREYKEGKLGISSLAKKHGIKSKSLLGRWINLYDEENHVNTVLIKELRERLPRIAFIVVFTQMCVIKN